jgi:MYXO-CTERM domain-containing protein
MQFTVSCQSTFFDLGIEDVAGLSDPCANVSCGALGSCMPHNGNPTCLCAPGSAAVNIGGSLTCAAVEQTYLASQLLWPEWPPVVETGDDDDTVSTGDDDDDDNDDDDDDDTSGTEQSGDTFQGLDSGVGCACDSAGSGQPGAAALALLVFLGVGMVRRRLN